MSDVAHDLASQVIDRGEDAAGNEVAFNLAEPDFDLVEPRGVGRDEVQVEVGMVGQELGDALGLMRRKVVDDDVDRSALGFEGDDLAQKGDELLGGMAGGGLTQDLAALGIEGRVKRERSVSVVFKAVALGAPRGQRQHRVEAIERLNGGLLIDAENRGVLRRIDVQPITSAALRSKSGSLEAM